MGRTDFDRRYAEPGFAYGTEPNAFLASVAGRIPRGRVLSLCEGEGRNAVFLATLGCRVTGVDASAVGLAKARRLAVERGVAIETVERDLEDFTIEPQAWDAIVSIFAHVPPGLRRRIHREVVGGLVPGGVFVLEAYTPAQVGRGTGGPPDPERTMSLADLTTELDGLAFEIARETVRDFEEGRFHRGPGHVVQVVAIRPRA